MMTAENKCPFTGEAHPRTNRDWWPADFGHYGPLFIRMMQDAEILPTLTGTPQGAVISPLLR